MRRLSYELPFDLSNRQGFNLIQICTGGDDTYINACGEVLVVNEKDIFIKNELYGDPYEFQNLYYFCICSLCGSIIRIDEKLIPVHVRERILNNCKEDLITYQQKLEEAKEIKEEYTKLKKKYNL